MNLSLCRHIQHIMVCTSDENIQFTGICRAKMKKKVQHKLALSVSSATAAITHAECGCPVGKGNLATCKHIGAFCFILEEFCRVGRARDFFTCTDRIQTWNHPKPARPVMIPVAELNSRRQEISAPLTSPPTLRKASVWDPRPMCLHNTCSEEIEKLRSDLLQAGTHCGLLQVLPVSTQIALHNHSYSSSTVTASTSLTSTPLAIAVADIPTSDASVSAHRDDPIDPSVKEALSISGEEIELIMQATTAQTNCGLWHEQQAKQITGSMVGRIVTQKRKLFHYLSIFCTQTIYYPSHRVGTKVWLKYVI